MNVSHLPHATSIPSWRRTLSIHCDHMLKDSLWYTCTCDNDGLLINHCILLGMSCSSSFSNWCQRLSTQWHSHERELESDPTVGSKGIHCQLHCTVQQDHHGQEEKTSHVCHCAWQWDKCINWRSQPIKLLPSLRKCCYFSWIWRIQQQSGDRTK